MYVLPPNPFATHHSPFTIHYSLFIIQDYSLFVHRSSFLVFVLSFSFLVRYSPSNTLNPSSSLPTPRFTRFLYIPQKIFRIDGTNGNNRVGNYIHLSGKASFSYLGENFASSSCYHLIILCYGIKS